LPPNVAVGKAASQSSTYGGYEASRAVDGDVNGNISGGSVSMTNRQSQAWWEVDLGGLYEIEAVQIWNRTGSELVMNRLSDFYVFISAAPFASTDPTVTANQAGVCSQYVSEVPSPEMFLRVAEIGQYVRVQLAGTDFVHMAEVMVFGDSRASGLLDDVACTASTEWLDWVDVRKTESEPYGMLTGPPDLRGMYLVDSDISSWAGQVVYLDFDGANGVV